MPQKNIAKILKSWIIPYLLGFEDVGHENEKISG